MTTPIPAPMPDSKPYILRALWQWFTDNNRRPFVTVDCRHAGVVVPPAYRGKITTFNLSLIATGDLNIGDDAITCASRFGGKSFHLTLPIAAVVAIHSPDAPQECGAVWPVTLPETAKASSSVDADGDHAEDVQVLGEEPSPEPTKPKSKPSFLTVVK